MAESLVFMSGVVKCSTTLCLKCFHRVKVLFIVCCYCIEIWPHHCHHMLFVYLVHQGTNHIQPCRIRYCRQSHFLRVRESSIRRLPNPSVRISVSLVIMLSRKSVSYYKCSGCVDRRWATSTGRPCLTCGAGAEWWRRC